MRTTYGYFPAAGYRCIVGHQLTRQGQHRMAVVAAAAAEMAGRIFSDY